MYGFGSRVGASVTGLLITLLVHGCSPVRTALAPGGQVVPAIDSAIDQDAMPADTALFAAVIRSLQAQDGRPLWVNPHPLSADPARVWFGSQDLADVPEQVVQDRATVLDRMGVTAFRAFPLHRCQQGRGGLPPRDAPEPTFEAIRCVLVSLPRRAYAQQPPEQIGDVGSKSGRWTVRVLTRDPAAYVVSNVTLERDTTSGAWRIVEQREVFRVMS